jgi:hypothetical protein
MTPNSEKLSDSETGKFFYIPHIATDRDPDWKSIPKYLELNCTLTKHI